MKTTVELPDQLLQQAKQLSASMGISLRELLIMALRRTISESPMGQDIGQPDWRSCFGQFSDDRLETEEIQRLIDSEFAKVDRGEWQ